MGAFAQVLVKDDFYKKYNKFITMNSSIRGPFFPLWSTQCWTDAYLNKVTDKVKVCRIPVGVIWSARWHFETAGRNDTRMPATRTCPKYDLGHRSHRHGNPPLPQPRTCRKIQERTSTPRQWKPGSTMADTGYQFLSRRILERRCCGGICNTTYTLCRVRDRCDDDGLPLDAGIRENLCCLVEWGCSWSWPLLWHGYSSIRYDFPKDKSGKRSGHSRENDGLDWREEILELRFLW